jgi:hypothetical protein
MFIEDDVPGCVHPACHGVEAAIASVVAWVADEDAGDGSRSKLVWYRGREIGIA